MKNLNDLTLEQLKEIKEAVEKEIKASEEKQKEYDKQTNQEKQVLSDEEIKQRIEDIAKSIDEEAGLVVLYISKNGFFHGVRGKRFTLSQAIGMNCLKNEDLFELMTQSLIAARITTTLRDKRKINNNK